MGLNVINANDIKTDNTTYLIYGPPGMGKTSTAKFFEGNTLVLDMDRTSHVLKGYKNIDIFYVDNQDTWKQWGELVKHLGEADLSKYQTIVLDNISELERSILANLGRDGKNNRVPEMRHYQMMQFFLVDSVRFLKSLGKRIVITAWETSDEWTTPEGQVFNRSYPQISNKILTNVMGLCDVVGKIVYNPKTEKRGYLLQPTNAVFAKNQLDNRKFSLQEELLNVGDTDDVSTS